MKKLSLFIVLLALAGYTIQAQTVRYVDNNQGAPTNANLNYTTIQAAIDASQPDDIIYVQPSPNSYGNITMTKPININGLAHNPELNAGQFALLGVITFNGAAGGSQISGLYFNNINLGTSFDNHDVVITNNRIFGSITGNGSTTRANNVIISGNYFSTTSGIFINNSNSQNWIISNNLFEHTTTSSTSQMFHLFNNTTILNNNIILTKQNGDTNQSIRVFNSCDGTQISNNIFLFTGTNVANMNLGANSALSFNNNLTYSVTTVFDALSGSNNIDDTDPQFVSWVSSNSLNNTTHDYNIQAGSPAENWGTDGNNLGVMNGAYPFDLRGYPTVLPYLTDFVIFNNIISVGTDLNINVKADANNN